jgi:hypothetical protein
VNSNDGRALLPTSESVISTFPRNDVVTPSF